MLQGCKKQLIAITLSLFAYSAIASDSSTQSELSVLLPEQGIRLDYDQPARLETVLKDVQLQAANQGVNFEPLQAQLFDLEKQAKVEALKQNVLSQLAIFQNEDPEQRANLVAAQINAVEFHYREFTSLDYDVVQSQLKQNPLLNGQYQLNIGVRNDNVNFVGAIKHVASRPHRAQWFLADYFRVLGDVRLNSASDSEAIVIQPDGEVQIAAYGHWNFTPHFLAPGALVFIPFDSVPSELSTLNDDLTQLYRHKVTHNNE
ncbi:capsule biosynthesis GfcC D2 domain-containing protein [Vibrio sp. E150_011]